MVEIIGFSVWGRGATSRGVAQWSRQECRERRERASVCVNQVDT